MPPWLLSHPARWIGTAALRDSQWQAEQHVRLTAAAEHWLQTLRPLLPALHLSGTALFATGTGESGYCKALYQALGSRALLVRIFEDIEGRSLLRFGLPLPTMREQVVRLISESVEECECAMG
jgi:cobalamin biosynthetic protein CobC